jgi:hypothetical protein
MSQNSGAPKARRIPYLVLLYFACAGASLYLLHTAGDNEFVTVFGFHAQKLALSSLLLFFAMLTILVHAVHATAVKRARVISIALVGGWLAVAALPISTLLKFNARVNTGTLVERHGNGTPLMVAAYEGNLQEMERLVASGADVNARNDVNNAALHFAAGATPVQNQRYRGSPEAVAFLVEHGADVNAQNNNGITPLMDSVYNNNLDSLNILLAHGADVNTESKYVATALSEAVIRRYRDIAVELLRHRADPNRKDFTGRTPLGAAENLHEDGLAETLRQYGAKE